MNEFPQIVVGTYEEFILGFEPQKEKDSNKYKFVQTFSTHSHQASIRCAAASGRLMASSGADEYINIYDMNEMRVSRVINYHNSTVTCLEFTPDKSHLISANQKGDIAIFQCRDWSLVKLWKESHKSANGVTSMSVHPTGSLLLTTGADNTLKFWNLIKGRLAYATNFAKSSLGCSLNFGLWSASGKYYAVCIGKQLEVYKTDIAAVIYKLNTNSKITCAVFCKKNLICIGTEEGSLEIHSLIQKKKLFSEQAHKSRLKCMSSFSKTFEKNGENKIESYLVTADSKGVIKLWSLKKKGENCLINLKCEVDCDCRIICLTIVSPKKVKEEKQACASENTNEKVESVTAKNQETNAANIKVNSVNNKKFTSKKKKRSVLQNGNFNAVNEETEISKTQNDKKNNKNKKRTLSEPCNGQKKGIDNVEGLKPKKKIKHSNFFNATCNKSRVSGNWSVKDV